MYIPVCRKIFFPATLFACFLSWGALSQSAPQKTDSTIKGRIHFIHDERIPALLERHMALNEEGKGVPGFRLQLFFGSGKQEAQDIRTQFLRLYPAAEVYLLYEQPYFKVRAGDFIFRLEALKFLKEISVDFPGAFVVRDDVKMPDIK